MNRSSLVAESHVGHTKKFLLERLSKCNYRQLGPKTKVTMTSQWTNKNNTMDIPKLDRSDFLVWHNAPKPTRPFVQDAFPQLSADEREFLMTGCTPEEWNEMFPPEKEDSSNV